MMQNDQNNNTADKTKTEETQSEPEKLSPYHKDLDALIDVLDRLYIKSNLSARNNFRTFWPSVARLVFPEGLLQYDDHGVKNDKEKEARAALEDEAEIRRRELLHELNSLDQNAVVGGMLQMDYIEKMAGTYGTDILEHVFAEHVLDKIKNRSQS